MDVELFLSSRSSEQKETFYWQEGRIALIFWFVSTLAFLFFPVQHAAAQVAKVRAVYPSINVQYLPAYLAQVKRIFAAEGLEAELIAVRGAKEGVQALVSGDIQFNMTVGPVLPAIWRGLDLKLLISPNGGHADILLDLPTGV